MAVPILLVHGFDGYGAKNATELASLASRLGRRARPVGFYAGDVGFDVTLAGVGATTDTSIDEIAWRLMEHVVRARAGAVDLVGHSLGGLVVGRAVQLLPPELVRRVVMVGVPFAGLPSAVGTPVAQCREMSPGSGWLAAVDPGSWRADLVVASEADEAVPVASATLVAGVEAMLVPAADRVHHGDLIESGEVLDRVAAVLS